MVTLFQTEENYHVYNNNNKYVWKHGFQSFAIVHLYINNSMDSNLNAHTNSAENASAPSTHIQFSRNDWSLENFEQCISFVMNVILIIKVHLYE